MTSRATAQRPHCDAAALEGHAAGAPRQLLVDPVDLPPHLHTHITAWSAPMGSSVHTCRGGWVAANAGHNMVFPAEFHLRKHAVAAPAPGTPGGQWRQRRTHALTQAKVVCMQSPHRWRTSSRKAWRSAATPELLARTPSARSTLCMRASRLAALFAAFSSWLSPCGNENETK